MDDQSLRDDQWLYQPLFIQEHNYHSVQASYASIIKDDKSDTLQLSKNFSITRPTNRRKPQKWSDYDTQLFYTCLEIYGQDFQMIKKVLSHKTLRQVLRKFHKEGKRNAFKVQQALNVHQSNLMSSDPRNATSLFDNFLNQSNNSELHSFDGTDESLEEVVNEKLRLLREIDKEDHAEKEPIMPLEFYLRDDL